MLIHKSNSHKNTSNIEAYIQWCNRLSKLINTEIVKHLKRDTRVKMIQFFIDVAQECFNNGNFNLKTPCYKNYLAVAVV